MKVLPKLSEFEWDKGNIDKNLKEHGVTNQEAEEVFNNDPKFILEDKKHSLAEKRCMLWGITSAGRRLTVIFTLRGAKIRVISARDMSREEGKSYVEKTRAYPKI